MPARVDRFELRDRLVVVAVLQLADLDFVDAFEFVGRQAERSRDLTCRFGRAQGHRVGDDRPGRERGRDGAGRANWAVYGISAARPRLTYGDSRGRAASATGDASRRHPGPGAGRPGIVEIRQNGHRVPNDTGSGAPRAARAMPSAAAVA